jgi:hypothetical protein
MLWVELLNRTCVRSGSSDAWSEWIDVAAPTRQQRQAWDEDVALLRRIALWRVLGRDMEAAAEAAPWFASITLRVALGGHVSGLPMPALRARRTSGRLPPVLDDLASTALAELFAMRDASDAAQRCCGVVRAEAVLDDATLEREFARRAGLTGLLTAVAKQCPRFVAGPRSGQYCCKGCSNAAFALRKAARDPGYFARKQATYRDRARRRTDTGPRRESAFSFVD